MSSTVIIKMSWSYCAFRIVFVDNRLITSRHALAFTSSSSPDSSATRTNKWFTRHDASAFLCTFSYSYVWMKRLNDVVQEVVEALQHPSYACRASSSTPLVWAPISQACTIYFIIVRKHNHITFREMPLLDQFSTFNFSLL